MNINKIKKEILKGYNSIPLGVEKIKWDTGIYVYKNEKYRFKEYAFYFPYYLDKEDLREVGKNMKRLEIYLTYDFEGFFDPIVFHGEVYPITKLLSKLEQFRIEVPMKRDEKNENERVINPNHKIIFVERVPLEIGKESVCNIGMCEIYTRFLVIID